MAASLLKLMKKFDFFLYIAKEKPVSIWWSQIYLPGDVKFLKIISDKFRTIRSSLFVIVFFLLESNKFKQYSRIDITFSLVKSNTDDTLNLHSNKLIEFIEAFLSNKTIR